MDGEAVFEAGMIEGYYRDEDGVYLILGKRNCGEHSLDDESFDVFQEDGTIDFYGIKWIMNKSVPI